VNLKYEPSSEPLHISAKYLFFKSRTAKQETVAKAAGMIIPGEEGATGTGKYLPSFVALDKKVLQFDAYIKVHHPGDNIRANGTSPKWTTLLECHLNQEERESLELKFFPMRCALSFPLPVDRWFSAGQRMAERRSTRLVLVSVGPVDPFEPSLDTLSLQFDVISS